MMLANEDVKMLQYTTAEITAPFLLPEMVGAFWFESAFCFLITIEVVEVLMISGDEGLRSTYVMIEASSRWFCVLNCGFLFVTLEFFVSQVERIAGMLNYFLLQLVGPQRKALRVKDPEKYEFRPKELLAQVWPKVAFSSALLGARDALLEVLQ